jgi:hypothetical protein
VRRLAKRGPKKPMEMEFGEASLTRHLLQQNARLVSGSEQVASAAEAAESVVMNELRHLKMILLPRSAAHLFGSPGATPNNSARFFAAAQGTATKIVERSSDVAQEWRGRRDLNVSIDHESKDSKSMMSRHRSFLVSAIIVASCMDRSVVTAFAAGDRSCCGSIASGGYKLAAVLDGMDVEAHWPAHEHVNWQTGEPDRRGENEGPGHTHCSAFAAAVAKKLGIYLLRPPQHGQKLLANAQAAWLDGYQGHHHGWIRLSGGQEAQMRANQGNLVLVVFSNPDLEKPGHVAVVRPSEKTIFGLRQEGPQIIQAGNKNYNSTVVRIGFKNHVGAFPDGVRYYAHPVGPPADAVLDPHN